MSNLIATAFVQQYKDNVTLLTQQKGSKLRRAVMEETIVGKSSYVDQIGATEARERASRHSDTPRIDTPHGRRRIACKDFDWADLIDKEDEIRMLADVSSKYAMNAAMAMGRAMDRVIVAAADSVAYAGEDGSSTVNYDTNMTVGVQIRGPGVTAANLGLNVSKILEAGEKLGSNDVDEEDEKWLIPNARQVKSLLNDTRISSGDYNVLKPLYDGQVVRFGGFHIIQCNRITEDANGYDKVLYWARGGLCLGIGADQKTKIGERADKNYATQVFTHMTIGATRLEEVRVGYIECQKTAGPG